MNELDLRVERFERTVALCLCTIPGLFSVQCIAVSLASRVFREMFVDYGTELPVLTSFVLRFSTAWGFIGSVVLAGCVLFALRAAPRKSVVISTIAAVFMFSLAQLLTLGVFLPILELATVPK
jgi:hypothetical protein